MKMTCHSTGAAGVALRSVPILLVLLAVLTIEANGQKKDSVTALFRDEAPLSIRIRLSTKDIKKNTNDTTYVPGVMFYQEREGTWDSLEVSLRSRGDFRLRECYFPPLRVKIKKGERKGTLFRGNKSLKLVLPCQQSDLYNHLIIKEYLCYQLYEAVTPYTFNTRMLRIQLTENSGKKDKEFTLSGFFIEDDDLVADRHRATIEEELKPHPLQMHDTSSIRHDLFQFMIGNIDWSTTFSHNEKIMKTQSPVRLIPLVYDFDMSGFVDAPYAVPNPDLGMTSVKDRVYRGFCRTDDHVLEYVRQEFIQKEARFYEILDAHKEYLSDKELAALKKYLESFFVIARNDNLFNREVVAKCRNK